MALDTSNAQPEPLGPNMATILALSKPSCYATRCSTPVAQLKGKHVEHAYTKDLVVECEWTKGRGEEGIS